MNNENNIKEQARDIMHYESKIWEIADLLRSARSNRASFQIS